MENEIIGAETEGGFLDDSVIKKTYPHDQLHLQLPRKEFL